MAFYNDLISEQYSYDEVIQKYKKLYPEYANKFTRDFCSKVRCGRVMKFTHSNDNRVKRIKKLSQRGRWSKMTQELFKEIYLWESQQAIPVKQSEVETKYNVNRSTYFRWKKAYLNSLNVSQLN
jgi:hypothetical protein